MRDHRVVGRGISVVKSCQQLSVTASWLDSPHSRRSSASIFIRPKNRRQRPRPRHHTTITRRQMNASTTASAVDANFWDRDRGDTSGWRFTVVLDIKVCLITWNRSLGPERCLEIVEWKKLMNVCICMYMQETKLLDKFLHKLYI